MVTHFRLGYSNRTLGYRLPDKRSKAGTELRGQLEQLGVMRGSGHEHLTGCITMPIFDEHGRVVEMYGRRVTRQRKGMLSHLYLPGPHRGVFNLAAVKASEEVILCESLIDALTFWCAGFRNVTTSYGTEGFSDDHRRVFAESDVKKVLIAYDRDEAGDKAAKRVSLELSELGITTCRVLFPKGMDANEYALKVQPAEQSLGLVLRKAEWMAGKSESELAAQNNEHPSLAAVSAAPNASQDTERDALPSATTSPMGNGDEVVIVIGDRRYRVRGFSKVTTPGTLRVNLFASREEAGFHVDTLELYSARQRQQFIDLGAVELGVEPRVLKKDLGQVLLRLETEQEERAKREKQERSKTPHLSEGDVRAAMELLKSPKLIERILSDFERSGVVGEHTNKLVGYLAAVSRKLEQPLAVVIQSSSAAGKSSLMDAVLSLIPEEERVEYSAMTGQSLFYMGEADLKHKVLAIVEEEGAERASYALKLLQSEGELTIASTGKDPQSGRLVTQEYRVEGPVMIFLTTTAIEVDEELLNRCLVLTVDEGRKQTRAIHERQRRAETLEGLLEKRDRKRIRKVHRDAQRLLRSLLVVNPFAEKLAFVDHATRTRRDHMKYLTLIRSIALLHQYQRPIRTVEHGGERVEYIEVIERDIELANRLCDEVLGRSLDELPPQTRRLLGLVDDLVREECQRLGVEREDFRFSRRTVREHVRWGQTQLRIHLGRLVEMEYLAVHRGGRGQGYEYELTYAAELAGSKAEVGGGLAGGWRTPGRQVLSNENAEVAKPRGVNGKARPGNGAADMIVPALSLVAEGGR
jgi:hypothetical protein